MAEPGAKPHPGVPPHSRWPCNALTNPDHGNHGAGSDGALPAPVVHG